MNNETILYKKGFTEDIINSVKSVFTESWTQTKQLANELKGNDINETFCNVWNYTININYILDPYGKQYIKTPKRFLKDKYGDCKSFSIFICSIFANLGYKTKFRFVTYSQNSNYSHVYPIVILNNCEIPFDVVATKQVKNKQFTEVPYIKKKDIMNNECSTQISKLSGIIEADSANVRSESFIFDISNKETLSTVLIKSFAFRYYNNGVFRTTEFSNLLIYGIEKSGYNETYIDRISLYIADYFFKYFSINKYVGSPGTENNKKNLDYFVENQMFDNDYINEMKSEIESDNELLKFWYMIRYYFYENFNKRVETSDNEDFETIKNIINCWIWFFPLCFTKGVLNKQFQNNYDYLYNMLNAMIQNTNIDYNSAINFIVGQCRIDTNCYPNDVKGIYVEGDALYKSYNETFIGATTEELDASAMASIQKAAKENEQELMSKVQQEAADSAKKEEAFKIIADSITDTSKSVFEALGKKWSSSSSSTYNIYKGNGSGSSNYTTYLILGGIGIALVYMISRKKKK